MLFISSRKAKNERPPGEKRKKTPLSYYTQERAGWPALSLLSSESATQKEIQINATRMETNGKRKTVDKKKNQSLGQNEIATVPRKV